MLFCAVNSHLFIKLCKNPSHLRSILQQKLSEQTKNHQHKFYKSLFLCIIEGNMEQARKIQVVYSPNYKIDYSGFVPGYPKFLLKHTAYPHLSDDKHEKVHELLAGSALNDRFEFVEGREATDEDLLLVHTKDYIASFRRDPRKVLEYFEIKPKGLHLEDIMLFPYINHQFLKPIRHVVGGTMQAGMGALERGVAVNLDGGYHHASSDNGGGFCIYNDIAVAIRYLQKNGLVEKVLIVDLDVHQGDGNSRIFSEDSNVFVFSMHADNIFPLKKSPSDLDVGLESSTGDERYLALLMEHLPAVLDDFKPDVVFYLAGADVYKGDMLGGLDLTEDGILRRDVFVALQAMEKGIPLAITLAGGYFKECPEVQAKSIEEIARH